MIAAALVAAPAVLKPSPNTPSVIPAATSIAPEIEGRSSGGPLSLAATDLRLDTETLGLDGLRDGATDGFDIALAVARARERRVDLISNLQRIDGLLNRAQGLGIETLGILGELATLGPNPGKPRPLGTAEAVPLAFAPTTGLSGTSAFDRFDVPDSVPIHRIRTAIETIDERIDRMELRQATLLKVLEDRIETETRSLVSVQEALGMPAPPSLTDEMASAIGGPLLPLGSAEPSDAITARVSRLEQMLSYSEQLRGVVDRLPVRRPLSSAQPVSSRFGPRRDPFTGRLAQHSGIDFKASTGTPVLATADGVVLRARRWGGYGKLIEIDHGNGIVTRYAHLSAMDVIAGDSVELGDKIGEVGSTGRSTGAHLHYEVRVAGIARNPLPYLAAGRALKGL